MITNREHYSWSQHLLFKSSKKSFYKKYVLGEEQKNNIRFNKGKEFAEYKETGEIPHYVEDPLLETVGKAVPSLDLVENKVLVDLFKDEKPPVKGIKPILMFMDSCNKDYTEFYEYKTGKEPWDKYKVQEHDQLLFYALGAYMKNGQETIPKCKLYWIETEDIENPDGTISVRYTGNIEVFEREFSKEELLRVVKDVIETQIEIIDLEYIEIELNDSLVKRYSELSKKKKEIDESLKDIKNEIELKLNSEGANYGKSEHGSFSIVRRKSYEYSDDLTKEIKENKSEMKSKMDIEVRLGIAKENHTEYLKFNPNK